jgi:tellurite resistance protein TehA-like permease
LGNDLASPQMVFSFFTLIAASNILGLQLELRGYATAAAVLWLTALSIWLALTYFSFGLLILSNSAAAPDLVVRGGWLLAIVATQSLVILGARLAAATLDPGSALLFFLIHALWGIAVVLYGLFITLFAHRVLYFRVDPDDLTAPLWVIMGAAAISANAGAALIGAVKQPGFLHAMSPFIGAASLIAWAWGTWWIPLLVMFGIWKHGIRRARLSYTAALWSMVFPLGMYAVATDRLSVIAELPPLRALAHGMAWIAVAAWLITALGLMLGSAASLRKFARCRADRG